MPWLQVQCISTAWFTRTTIDVAVQYWIAVKHITSVQRIEWVLGYRAISWCQTCEFKKLFQCSRLLTTPQFWPCFGTALGTSHQPTSDVSRNNKCRKATVKVNSARKHSDGLSVKYMHNLLIFLKKRLAVQLKMSRIPKYGSSVVVCISFVWQRRCLWLLLIAHRRIRLFSWKKTTHQSYRRNLIYLTLCYDRMYACVMYTRCWCYIMFHCCGSQLCSLDVWEEMRQKSL